MQTTDTPKPAPVLPRLPRPEYDAVFGADSLDYLRHATDGLMFLSRLAYAVALEDDEREEPDRSLSYDRGCLYSAMIGLSALLSSKLDGRGDEPPDPDIANLFASLYGRKAARG